MPSGTSSGDSMDKNNQVEIWPYNNGPILKNSRVVQDIDGVYILVNVKLVLLKSVFEQRQ
jgi:hypothetical protein